MTTNKGQFEVMPDSVPRDEFDRILGNMIATDPIKRKDARTGKKKTERQIIPPKPQTDSQ